MRVRRRGIPRQRREVRIPHILDLLLVPLPPLAFHKRRQTPCIAHALIRQIRVSTNLATEMLSRLSPCLVIHICLGARLKFRR